jgi:glycosyltransferase involved in cell wall biosynthesis
LCITGSSNRIFNEKMAVSVNTPMIGILGVLTRWKGQLEFLKMAKELIRRGSDAMFVVIGGEIYDTGADRGYGLELKIEAERLGIVNRIYFTGFEADPARMINGLDVLVHASIKPEPFGRVILEAMACGVPVAASAAGGVLEFVKNDATGRLFSPGNTVEMADAVEVLTKNAVIRDALIKRARDQFLLKFTTAHHARAVARYYDGIISE